MEENSDTGTSLEAGLIDALAHLLAIAGAFNTRHEKGYQAQMILALEATARKYAATVNAIEKIDNTYGWRLSRGSDGMQTRVIVPARPKTDDMVD